MNEATTRRWFFSAAAGVGGVSGAALALATLRRDADGSATPQTAAEAFGYFGPMATAATLQAALDHVGANGGTLLIPPGLYEVDKQLTLTPTTLRGIHILGYGAEIVTTGRISGIRVVSAYNLPAQIVIEGLKINQRGDADALAGFELVQSNHVTLRNCEVEAHGNGARYAAFLMRQSDVNNPDSGCYWNTLEECTVRQRSGRDGTIPKAVWFQGSCNASKIVGGSFSGCVEAVHISPAGGQTGLTNALLIQNVAFEACRTAVRVAGQPSVAISGLRVVGCRAESTDIFLSFTGSTAQPVTPPYMAGNYLVSDTTYIDNPNGLHVVSLDNSTNAPNGPEMDVGGPMRVRNTSGTGQTLTLGASATGAAVQEWLDDEGGLLARFQWVTDDNATRCRLIANSGSMAVTGVMGLSATGSDARNLRGSVRLARGAAAVAFANAEPDAAYFLSLTGNANEIFRWSSKARGGFTITSSNPASTATVDWHLIR